MYPTTPNQLPISTPHPFIPAYSSHSSLPAPHIHAPSFHAAVFLPFATTHSLHSLYSSHSTLSFRP
jgi:hypothetical protein